MEAVEPTPEPPKEPSMLDRIRNMWEFAALTQYIFTFGKAVKIDENLDTEVRLHITSTSYTSCFDAKTFYRNWRWHV
jgi:hypothetical protein